jgi:hypothetical protein
MSTHALLLVRMDVAHDHEATFNEVYDAEHVPNLRGVPGVRRAARYRQPSPVYPRYVAAYEVQSTELPMSRLWNDTSDIGRWKPEVRPYTSNKRFIVSERIPGR